MLPNSTAEIGFLQRSAVCGLPSNRLVKRLALVDGPQLLTPNPTRSKVEVMTPIDPENAAKEDIDISNVWMISRLKGQSYQTSLCLRAFLLLNVFSLVSAN